MAIKIHKKLAKSISYDTSKKRSLNSIKYIVIHYTGNKGDTAKGNATYFATSNTRQAGAHFFVDKGGKIYKSINMNRIAWAVGGKYSTSNGAGSYYGNVLIQILYQLNYVIVVIRLIGNKCYQQGS